MGPLKELPIIAVELLITADSPEILSVVVGVLKLRTSAGNGSGRSGVGSGEKPGI